MCTSVSVTIRETLLASSLARRVRDISRARASSHARVGWSANRRKERGGEEEEGKRITVLLQSGNDADRVQQFRAIPPEYRAFRECGSAFSRPLYISLPLSAVASLSLSLSVLQLLVAHQARYLPRQSSPFVMRPFVTVPSRILSSCSRRATYQAPARHSVHLPSARPRACS